MSRAFLLESSKSKIHGFSLFEGSSKVIPGHSPERIPSSILKEIQKKILEEIPERLSNYWAILETKTKFCKLSWILQFLLNKNSYISFKNNLGGTPRRFSEEIS